MYLFVTCIMLCDSARDQMIQFQTIRQDISDVKHLLNTLIRQSQAAEEVIQIPEGIELPLKTMEDIDDLERIIDGSADVKTKLVTHHGLPHYTLTNS